jgi:hypothetical protein
MLPAVRSARPFARAVAPFALALLALVPAPARALDPLEFLTRGLPEAPATATASDLGVTAAVPAAGGRLAQPASLTTAASWSFESDVAGRQLGLAATPAGDVNGDGVSDFVAVGDVNTFNTALYLFLGSSSGPALAAGYPVTDLPAGMQVSAAGDVNGDGFFDVVVLRHTDGLVRVYFGGVSGFGTTGYQTISGHFGSNLIGFNVAPAGDIDNDGYDDVIFGMPFASGGSPCGLPGTGGVAEVLYGSAAGLDVASYWTTYGCNATGTSAQLGTSVAGAGDVNGDGYADVLIGAPSAPDFSTGVVGKVYVMYGAASRLPLINGFSHVGSVTSGTTLMGHGVNTSFGRTVAPAGDVNGDGYADVAVGAPLEDVYATDGGRAIVFRGTAGGTDSSFTNAIWWEGGPTPNEQLGSTVAPAGDVNGDGLADLLVGENGGLRLAQAAAGTLFLDQFLAYAPLSTLACTAGDVNGDGLSDLLVAERGFANGQASEGRVLVHLGVGSGPSTGVNWSSTQIVLDNDNYGWSVASAGDVNGDGYDDVLLGAPSWYDWSTPGNSNNGLVMLFYGHASGPSTSPDWTKWGASGDQLGVSVASAGDVNGDGYGDIIVGAHTASGNTGLARVWYGGALGLGASPNVTLNGVTAGGYFGNSVACAGDVNGDGYPDVIVGAPYAVDPTSPQSQEGRAYVYHGGSGGLGTTPQWTLSGVQVGAHLGTSVAGAGDVNGDGFSDVVIGSPEFDATSKLGVVTPDAGRVIVGYGSSTGVSLTTGLNVFSAFRLGASVAGAGDVNGDGYSDIVVGAPSATNTISGEGAARVYAGSASGVSSGPLWTEYGGEAFGGFGSSVSSAGDADGDGLSDVLIGAVFQDKGGAQDQGFAYVYRGPLAPGTTPFWSRGGGSSLANIGHCVANAGDVNGDGWSDLVFGLPGYNGSGYRQGLVNLYLGANGVGRTQLTIPFRLSPAARVIHPGNLTDPGQITLAGNARSAAGRAKVRMQYRVSASPVFPLAPLTGTVATWTLTGAPGANGSVGTVIQNVTGLTNGVPYAWQFRTLAKSVYFPTGIWRSPVRNGRLETDARAPGTWLDVAASVAPASLMLADVRPNPMRGAGTLVFSLSRPGPARLDVVDVQGRRVRTLASGTRAAGEHRVAWDGRADDGHVAGPGVYFVRLEAEGRTLSRKVAMMR